MGDYKTRSVAMLFKSYISTSLLSSLFVACTFTLFSDGGFRGVYWFIFGLTFFISLPLNLLFLFFAIKINMKFGGAFAFVFVFFMGFASVSAVIYFLLQRIPGMDVTEHVKVVVASIKQPEAAYSMRSPRHR
ncbi:hypothetical protein [Paracidovorax avenae]|uniref:hypothetical protein n=1 Tax=Paracidovorax avenae TaxID=80867 RepID=UPI001AD818B8|nr:hypothetical protein [Paracidovorax avenae]